MKKLLSWSIICVSIVLASGCGNLSPRLAPKQKNNIQGKIGEIQSDQNSNRVEMLNMKRQLEMTNSRLDRMQEGVGNAQNNGTIEILSGPGGLVAAIVVLME